MSGSWIFPPLFSFSFLPILFIIDWTTALRDWVSSRIVWKQVPWWVCIFYPDSSSRREVATSLETPLFLPTLRASVLLENLESWLSYSQGFRNPSLSDLFSQSPFFTGNPQLAPERSEQYEYGLKSTSKPYLKSWDFDLRLFHIEYSNFIESFQIKPGVFSRRNRGRGYARGMDLELQWNPGFLKTSLNYHFLQTARRSTGQAFRLSPLHQIRWSASRELGVLKLELQNIHWYKNFDANNNKNVRLRDWQQWNLLFHLSPGKQWNLGLGLINVFNEPKEFSLNYPEPQRRYWFQIRYHFL